MPPAIIVVALPGIGFFCVKGGEMEFLKAILLIGSVVYFLIIVGTGFYLICEALLSRRSKARSAGLDHDTQAAA
jgi:hypothetical protein